MSSPGTQRGAHQIALRATSRISPARLEARAVPGGALQMQEHAWYVTDVDGLFAFALVASLLFSTELGTLGAAAFSGCAVAYGCMRLFRLHEILAPRWFLLFIPFMTVFSAVWSETPKDTLRYALEYSLTVGVGVLLAAAPRPKAVLFGIVAAFTAYMVVSLIFGGSVRIGLTEQVAFSGLGTGKNRIADIASTGLLLSGALFLICREDRQPHLALGAMLASVVQLYVLYLSRSAGAMLALALAGTTLLFLLAIRPLALTVRSLLTGMLGVSLLAIALASRTISEAITEWGARFFDKDPTFTGRTFLWQRASELIAERPTLGRGFHAFWQQGNLDAEGLWQFGLIDNRTGFNFHNTPIEVLVHLGWLGLAVCAAVLILASGFLIGRCLVRPQLITCTWLTVLVYELVRMPIESIGFNEFYYPTVLLFLALGSAFAPLRENYVRTRGYRAFASPPVPHMQRIAKQSGSQPLS